jgi:hypothetical protein
MVLDLHREPLVVGVERRTFRHGPRLEDPIKLQPQVVVQVRRRVLLDDETKIFCGFYFGLAARLLGLREVSWRGILRAAS